MKYALYTLFATCAALHAGTIAYQDPANSGNQYYGFPGNLASNFTVNTAITVTKLGVFNAAGDGNIIGSIQVVIFDANGNEVTPEMTFHGSYTAVGYDVFQSLAVPVVLGPGAYQVDTVGWGADPDGNFTDNGITGPTLNDGGGLLSFTGAAFNFSDSLVMPTTCDACVAGPQQWDAGTFEFEAGSATPEPGSVALLGLGLAAFGLVRRRRA